MNNDRVNNRAPYLLSAGLVIAGVALAGATSPCKRSATCSVGQEDAAACPSPACSPDDVVVTVNGTEITQAEVDKELRSALGAGESAIPDEALAEARTQYASQVEEMLIVQVLLDDAARRASVAITPEEVEDANQSIAARLPPDTTLDDVKARLGVTAEEWTETLTRDLRIEKLLSNEIGDLVEPSDTEVETFYTENESLLEQAGLTSLDTARDAILAQLRMQKQQMGFERYLNELKAKAAIAYPDTEA